MLTKSITDFQLNWEDCLTKCYGLEKKEAEAILSQLPSEIYNEKMTDLFLSKTKEIVPANQEPWDEAEDAICAAPKSHIILAENHLVRVLQVSVEPGMTEPFHTHKWTSIMVVARQSQLIYFTKESSRSSNPPIGVYQLPPEKLHAVKNTGEQPFLAFRFEIKNPLQEANL